MGMDSAPAHGWVISDEKLREICPKEYNALIHILEQVHQISLGDLARDFQMEVEVDEEIAHTYIDLTEAFAAATEINSGHLSLSLQYYDEESGGLYDELELSHYWDVEGMTQLTPAGKKFSAVVEEKSWTQFG